MQSQGNKSAETMISKQFYKPGRRPRVPLSCDPCRSRKLRCNREQPCQNCNVRGEQATCKYSASEKASALPPRREHADIMQQRIDRLEDLVKTLVAKDQHNSRLDDSFPPDDALWGDAMADPGSKSGSGTMRTTNGTPNMPGSARLIKTTTDHTMYRNTSDWSDLLKEVTELKRQWNLVQDDSNDDIWERNLSAMVDGPTLLCGQVKPVGMSELLATLPPRSQVDKLIHKFFDRRNFAIPTVHILHEPTFMREYSEHWRNPSETNVMWLGLLFSILCFTMLSYHHFEEEPPEYEGITEVLSNLYRLRTAQCLMIGDITKCLPYTLETLIYNSIAEYCRKEGSDRGLWMMTGVCVRVAINMGYHRDPSQYDNISVLQMEIRRRVWSSVAGTDGMTSFLVGFPSMMSAVYSDTLEPRNLFDWELTEATRDLPPSRPLSEFTSVTYLIVKGSIMCALGLVTEFNNSLQPGSYDRLLEIDGILHEAFEKVPPHMRLSDTDASQAKSISMVSILQLEFLYHRGMCILHRKFLAPGKVDRRYRHSRDRCIASALALLAQQDIRHAEARSMSPSPMPYWRKVSYTSHFFVLAAMILFLDLEHRRKEEGCDTSPPGGVLLDALEKSCAIWKEVKTSSGEAWRVYHVLANLLLSFGLDTETPCQNEDTQATGSSMNIPLYDSGKILRVGGDISEASNEMDIDWTLWDSFVEGASFDDAYQAMPFNYNDSN